MRNLLLLFISFLFLSSSQAWSQCPSTASFNYSVSGLEVSLFNTSQIDQPANNQTRFDWYFQENSTSSSQHTSDTNTIVKYTYSSAGTYWITMILEDSLNSWCLDTAEVYVTVGDTNCTAGFAYSVNGLDIQLIDQSSNATYLYYVIVNTGDTLYGNNNPSYSFNTAGNYMVCQHIFNTTNGCSDIICDTIIVHNNSCYANFTTHPDTTQLFSITLLNNSSNLSGHNYFWDFGDSITSTQRLPTHQYNDFGSYMVCLTVSDSILNCSSTFCDTVSMDSNGFMFRGGFSIVVRDSLLVTGLDEETAKSTLKVFPNPVSDQLTISYEGMEISNAEISLLDLQGKEILLENAVISNKSYRLNLQKIPSGIYFLRVQGASSSFVQKIIKR